MPCCARPQQAGSVVFLHGSNFVELTTELKKRLGTSATISSTKQRYLPGYTVPLHCLYPKSALDRGVAVSNAAVHQAQGRTAMIEVHDDPFQQIAHHADNALRGSNFASTVPRMSVLAYASLPDIIKSSSQSNDLLKGVRDYGFRYTGSTAKHANSLEWFTPAGLKKAMGSLHTALGGTDDALVQTQLLQKHLTRSLGLHGEGENGVWIAPRNPYDVAVHTNNPSKAAKKIIQAVNDTARTMRPTTLSTIGGSAFFGEAPSSCHSCRRAKTSSDALCGTCLAVAGDFLEHMQAANLTGTNMQADVGQGSLNFQFGDDGALVETEAPQVGECKGSVVLVLDGSASLGNNGWNEQMKFASQFINRAAPWFTKGAFQAGITVYEAKPARAQQYVPAAGTLSGNLDDLNQKLRRLRYPRTLSKMDQGLNGAFGMLKNATGARAVILLSDGGSTNKELASAAANEIKAAGIKIFAVGTGNADEAELKAIVSAPAAENITLVDDNAGLEKLAHNISQYCPVENFKVDCVTTDWTEFSECSDACGGSQTRSRKVYAEGTASGLQCTAVPMKDTRSCQDAKKCKPNAPLMLPDDCVPNSSTTIVPKIERVKLQFDSIVWVQPKGITITDTKGNSVDVPAGDHSCISGNGSKSIYVDLLDELFGDSDFFAGPVKVVANRAGVKDYVPWGLPEAQELNFTVVPPAAKIQFNPQVAPVSANTPIELRAANAQYMCYTMDGTDPDCGSGEAQTCSMGDKIEGDHGFTGNLEAPGGSSDPVQVRVRACSAGGPSALMSREYFPVMDKPENVRQCRLADGAVRGGFYYDAEKEELLSDVKAGNDQSVYPNRYGRYFLRAGSRNSGNGNSTCYLAPEDFTISGVVALNSRGEEEPSMVARNRSVDMKFKLAEGMRAINGPLSLRVAVAGENAAKFKVTPEVVSIRGGKSISAPVAIRALADAPLEDDIPLTVEVEKKANNLNSINFPENATAFPITGALGVSGNVEGIELAGGRVDVPAGGTEPTPVSFQLVGPVVQGAPITLKPTAPGLVFTPTSVQIPVGAFKTPLEGGFTVSADGNTKLGAAVVSVDVEKDAGNTNTFNRGLKMPCKGTFVTGFVTDVKAPVTEIPVGSTGCCQVILSLDGVNLKAHGDTKVELKCDGLEFQPKTILFKKGSLLSERVTVNVKPDCALGPKAIDVIPLENQPGSFLSFGPMDIGELSVVAPMKAMGEMEEFSYKRILSQPRSYPEQWGTFYGNTPYAGMSPCRVKKTAAEVRGPESTKLRPMYLIRPKPVKGRALRAVNTGNNLKVEMSQTEIHLKGGSLFHDGDGNSLFNGDGDSKKAEQEDLFYVDNMHFHVPGEHEINGKIADAEMVTEFKMKGNESQRLFLLFPLVAGGKSDWLAPMFDAFYRIQCRGGATEITTFEWDYYTQNNEYLEWAAGETQPPFEHPVNYIMDTKFQSISREQLAVLSQVVKKNNNKHGNNRVPLTEFEPKVFLTRYPGGMNQAVMNSLNLSAARAPENLFAESDLESAAKELGLSVSSTDPDMFPSIFSDVPYPWREGWKAKWTQEQHEAAAKNSSNAKIFEDPELAGKPNPYYQPIKGIDTDSAQDRVYKMDPKTGKMILVSGSEGKGSWATAMDLATPDMAKDAIAEQMEGAFAKPQGPSPQEIQALQDLRRAQMAQQINFLQQTVAKLAAANDKKLPPVIAKAQHAV